MPNYYPRRIQPADSLLYDAQGNLVGLRSGTSGDEAIFGLSASELAETQALVSGGGNSAIPMPVHLPVMSPERHSAMAPVVSGGLTMSYQAGGERGRGMIRFACAGAVANQTIRLPLPLSAEYGTYARVSNRVHLRIKCSDWTQVTRIYCGLGQGGNNTDYHLLKIVEANITRIGATDPAQSTAWNNKWRTVIESSDKRIVIGAPALWNADNRYYDTDALVWQITTAGACTIEIDRIYSPDWPVGFVTLIGDGAYGTFRDVAIPAFNTRGWKLAVSGNRVDGSTSGVIRYPNLADLASIAAMGHDVFPHGHYLSGSTPVSMTSSVTEAEASEIIGAARAAIAAATGPINTRGMWFHQWLTNTGAYAGTDMAGLLRGMGVRSARGSCSDAEFGINPYQAKTSTWTSSPATDSSTDLTGWVSHRGRFNRDYAELWDGISAATPEARDVYAGGGMQKGLNYAANNGDGFIAYAHNLIAYDGVNPLNYDAGLNLWTGFLEDLTSRVNAGKLMVLSPSQLEAATYSRPGDVYLRWDGEWVNRSDGSIAF